MVRSRSFVDQTVCTNILTRDCGICSSLSATGRVVYIVPRVSPSAHPRLYRFVAVGDLKLHTNIFLFRKKLECFEAAFAADAAVFHTAEERPEITEHPAIDPDEAAF